MNTSINLLRVTLGVGSLDQGLELGLPEHGDALASPEDGILAEAAGPTLDVGPVRPCWRDIVVAPDDLRRLLLVLH